jgi:hypothetical protein
MQLKMRMQMALVMYGRIQGAANGEIQESGTRLRRDGGS